MLKIGSSWVFSLLCLSAVYGVNESIHNETELNQAIENFNATLDDFVFKIEQDLSITTSTSKITGVSAGSSQSLLLDGGLTQKKLTASTSGITTIHTGTYRQDVSLANLLFARGQIRQDIGAGDLLFKNSVNYNDLASWTVNDGSISFEGSGTIKQFLMEFGCPPVVCNLSPGVSLTMKGDGTQVFDLNELTFNLADRAVFTLDPQGLFHLISLTANGPGTLVITDKVNSNADVSGVFRLDGCVLDLSSASSLTNKNSFVLSDLVDFQVNSGKSVTIASSVSGSGDLAKTGGGTLTLTGTNTHSETAIEAGILSVASGAPLGAGIVQLSGGVFQLTGAGTISNVISLVSSASSIETLSDVTLSGIISGSATLDKKGSAKLTLSNLSNSYSGGTNISQGVLSISSSSNLGSTGKTITFSTPTTTGTLEATTSFTLSNPIDLGGNSGRVTVASGQVLTLSGPFTGSSSSLLEFQGPGTLEITSTSTNFMGSSAITGGTLQISDVANLGGSNTSFIDIDGGTLKITAATSSTSRELKGLNGGMLLESGVTAIFNGAISPAKEATLVRSGSGRCEIIPSLGSAINSYIPTVKVNAGTFVGNNISLYGSKVALASGTSLIFNQTGTGEYTGNDSSDGGISGSGSVEKIGSGKLTFLGRSNYTKNTYTGDTILSEGTLSMSEYLIGSGDLVGNGGTFEATGSFTVPNDVFFASGVTTFYVDGNRTELTLSGDIGGECGVDYVKDGSGELIVNGESEECSVITALEDSFSFLPPSFPGVTVRQGLLGGNGSVGDVVVQAGAGVEGGNFSEEDLNVLGNLTLQSGSFLVDNLSMDASSSITVSGVLDIQQGANVFLLPTSVKAGQAASTYTIITSTNEIVGRFEGVDVPAGLLLNAILSYPNSQTVQLTVFPISIGTSVKGSNAVATSKALKKVLEWNREHFVPSFSPGSQPQGVVLGDVLQSLVPFVDSSKEMTYAMNQLNPALFKAVQVIQESASTEVRQSLSYRLQQELDCKLAKRPLNVWINGMGDVLNQQSGSFGKSPQVGYRSTLGGFTAGADVHFAKYFYAGALGGFTSAHVNYKENQGRGDVNTGYAGLYFSAIGEMFYGNISTIGGWSGYQGARNIHYTGVSKQAKNHHTGRELLTHADTGVNFKFGRFTLRPFDQFDYQTQTENGFGEKGAGQWNLSVKKSNSQLLRNELGLQFASCFCFNGSKWSLAPKLSWVREVRVKGAHYKTAFREAEFAPFSIVGYFPDRSLISPGLLVSGSMLEERLALSFYYDGEFRGDYSANRYGGELRYSY